MRWMVNGTVKLEREHDLTANRTATVAELGAVAGDTVQVCVVEDGIVGWWGSYKL